MKLSKISNFEEYLDVITIMARDLSNASLERIGMAINVCDSYMDEQEKIYRLNTTLKKCLWEYEEAINMGFHKFIIKETGKIKELLNYHKFNCEGESCDVCNVLKETKSKMVNNNEREEPAIYSQ